MNREALRKPTYAITSVDHALRLIQVLRDLGELRISDAARELGIAPSTAHRLLAMLVYRGFAIQDESRVYAPGPALGAGPSNAPWTRLLRSLALPHLELLSGHLGETVNLMFRVGSKVRFLASVESEQIVRVGDRTGTVLHARAASGGKALLAELDPAHLERMYRSRAAEVAGEYLDDNAYAALRRELIKVRSVGHATNLESTESGVCAIGTTLRNGAGTPLAAVTVAVPTSRAAVIREPRTIELLAATRADIEADMFDLDPGSLGRS